MFVNPAYSVTSNTVKLLKHLNKLRDLQLGKVTPIIVHTMPTHRCNLNCVHCCFKNRDDLKLDIDPDVYMSGVDQFRKLGTKALELTGGGEPTLYPYIDACLDYFFKIGFSVGLITNGTSLFRVERFLKKFAWVRVSLNTIDYVNDFNIDKWIGCNENFSFCYIWNEHSFGNIHKINEFVNKYKKPCRISPDCIKPLNDIEFDLIKIKEIISNIKNNDYLFLSDFNTTVSRRNNNCYIHFIKPAFYTDGYIYSCPSAELAIENDKKINKSAIICHSSNVYEFYNNLSTVPIEHDCSYCKYSKQQDLIEDVLTETNHNDFA